MSHRLAVDLARTFIDVSLLDEESGDFVSEKQPADPSRPVAEPLQR